MRRDLRKVLAGELRRHGITEHRIEQGGKHPRLCFEVNGRSRFYVTPGTSFDGPSRQKIVADLRRMLRGEGAGPTQGGSR